MPCNPILVGVDGSPESAAAVALGEFMSLRTGASCRLVHAAPDFQVALAVPEAVGLVPLEALEAQAAMSARRLIEQSLDDLPSRGARRVEVKVGRPSVVLSGEAAAMGAEVVILGCKHRRALARMASSTITHLVRRGTVPVLATDRPRAAVQRIVAAVDLSWAAAPTIRAAERWAELTGAELRILHAVEPPPVALGSLPQDGATLFRAMEMAARQVLLPLITLPRAELVIHPGRAAAAITSEVTLWRADLLVVGSHGKGWVDRLLIGSTSERLLHVLPAPTLVIPVSQPAEVDSEAEVAVSFTA